MEFKKKLKTRLYMAVAYIVIGIAIIATTFIIESDNDFISSLGFAWLVMGIIRLRNYFMITKDDNSIKKQEIAESDERNISIDQKAKSTTFTVYLMLSCLAVIVLSILSLHEVSRWISYSVLLLIVIYWISRFIYQKIS